MTQYNTFILTLSYSQFSTLKLEIKYGTEVTLSLSLNIVGNSSDDTIFHTNYYQLSHKFQKFVKLLQMVIS